MIKWRFFYVGNLSQLCKRKRIRGRGGTVLPSSENDRSPPYLMGVRTLRKSAGHSGRRKYIINMKILIDNGHGVNTAGKCSPDKRLMEWTYTREIAQMLVEKLVKAGYDAMRIVTETNDISLLERCRRVNEHCRRLGAKNCMCVSIHVNAAPGGRWNIARGCSFFVGMNASESSKRLARIFTEQGKKMGLMGNRCIPSSMYWQQNLAMCRDTKCPAVLTENLFMDNKEDVELLLSAKGKKAIVDMHFEAIVRYIRSVEG